MRLGGVTVLVVPRAIHADKGPSSCDWIATPEAEIYRQGLAKMKILIERSQQGWIFQFVFSSPPVLHFG